MTLVRALGILCLVPAIAACTTYRVEERQSYWRDETSKHLPIGSTMAQAHAFFAQRGLRLSCCVSSPGEIPASYLVVERQVGRNLLVVYDVAVLVHFSHANLVNDIKVMRWGVGF